MLVMPRFKQPVMPASKTCTEAVTQPTWFVTAAASTTLETIAALSYQSIISSSSPQRPSDQIGCRWISTMAPPSL
jgi:hypothetical protein